MKKITVVLIIIAQLTSSAFGSEYSQCHNVMKIIDKEILKLSDFEDQEFENQLTKISQVARKHLDQMPYPDTLECKFLRKFLLELKEKEIPKTECYFKALRTFKMSKFSPPNKECWY